MIVIVSATGSNLNSIKTAIERLGHQVTVSNDIDVIDQASHVILPGVGTAQLGMRQLKINKLVDVIRQLTCPVLGICLGMQLLFEYSFESEVECLGVIPGCIHPLQTDIDLPIPHMGWNTIEWVVETPLANGISEGSYVYFIHSFAVSVSQQCLARTKYGIAFASIVQKDNFYGMQFHPEKSGRIGSQLLANFCALRGS